MATPNQETYMTSNIDEAAYLVCRGAKIDDYILATSGNWISFQLVGVEPEYRLGFGDVKDRTVGVPEFIAKRNQLKAKMTELNGKVINRGQWKNNASRS